MSEEYFQIPKRLLAYRKAMNKTQEEMGEQFGVNQSHYCKLEAGNNIISYESLENFRRNGGDVYFLFTDRMYKAGEIDAYLDRCQTEYGKQELLKLAVWLTNQGIRLQNTNQTSVSRRTY